MLYVIAFLLFVIVLLLGAIINRLDYAESQSQMNVLNAAWDLGRVIEGANNDDVMLKRIEMNRKNREKEV